MVKVRSNSIEVAFVATLLLLTSLYSIAFAIGPSHLGDDVWYSWLAHYASISAYKQNFGDILSVRPLQIIPIGTFYYLFGSGIYTSNAWDAISFVLTVLLTYLIGKELYNWKVGVIAASLLAIFPMANIYSVTMSDNIPLMFLATLAVFAFIKGTKRRSRKWYIVSGAATAAAPFVIPEGFIFWIIMAVVLLWEMLKGERSRKYKAVYAVCGFTAVIAVMVLFNYVTSGYPFITFTANAQYYSQIYRPDIMPQPISIALAFYPSVMFPYSLSQGVTSVVSILTYAQQSYGKSGLFFYAMTAALAYLIITKDRRIAIPAIWIIVGFAYLEFGPMHFSLSPLTYILSHRLDRYLTLIGPPLSVAIAGAAFDVVRRSRKRYSEIKIAILTLGFVVLAITSFEITYSWHLVLVDSQYTELSIAGMLNQLSSSTKVYLDAGYGDLAVYMGFRNFSRFYLGYGGANNCSEIPGGSYVVIPRYGNDGFSFVPDPLIYCDYWIKVMSPQVPYNSTWVIAPTQPFEADLYYVPANYTYS